LKAHRKSGGTVFIDTSSFAGVFRQANFELMQTDSLQVDPEKKQQPTKLIGR